MPRDTVKALARGYTAEAIRTLAAVMRDSRAPAAVRVDAANALLDRAWGKAEATAIATATKDFRAYSAIEILAALASADLAEDEAQSEPGNYGRAA